jgi:hypothetical protein
MLIPWDQEEILERSELWKSCPEFKSCSSGTKHDRTAPVTKLFVPKKILPSNILMYCMKWKNYCLDWRSKSKANTAYPYEDTRKVSAHTWRKRKVKQESFVASHGCFSRFRNYANLYNVKVSADTVAAELPSFRTCSVKYLRRVSICICQNRCLMSDQTGLFWKRMLMCVCVCVCSFFNLMLE